MTLINTSLKLVPPKSKMNLHFVVSSSKKDLFFSQFRRTFLSPLNDLLATSDTVLVNY